MFEKIEPWMLSKAYNRTKVPYDYMSILHPPFDWFSMGYGTVQTPVFSSSKYLDDFAWWTIKTKDERFKFDIGQRRTLSYLDQRRVNLAYHAPIDEYGMFKRKCSVLVFPLSSVFCLLFNYVFCINSFSS